MRRPPAPGRVAGQAARTIAPPRPAGGTFVAGEDFTLPFRMQTLSFRCGLRYTAEPALRTLIASTDVRVTWEE